MPVRYASVIRVRPEKLEEYKELHAECWPGVLKTIRDANIRNYGIHLYNNLLFSYLEYVGNDYGADMAKIAACPITREWWELTDPCQERVPEAKDGEWWHAIEEVFHTD